METDKVIGIMRWIVVIIIAVMLAVILLFMRGATRGRPDWYQRELDDEQMKAISKMNKKKRSSEDEPEEKD